MKITKRQTLSLLRKVQKLQVEDCGKHNISINCYIDKKLWFTYAAKFGENYLSCACYEWREYEENLEMMENFIETVRNDG